MTESVSSTLINTTPNQRDSFTRDEIQKMKDAIPDDTNLHYIKNILVDLLDNLFEGLNTRNELAVTVVKEAFLLAGATIRNGDNQKPQWLHDLCMDVLAADCVQDPKPQAHKSVDSAIAYFAKQAGDTTAFTE